METVRNECSLLCRHADADMAEAPAMLGLAASATFAVVLWRWGEVARRLPPSVAWVLGPGLLLAGLPWLCERAPRLPSWLLAPGRHVLLSLVASNLLIFGARFLWGQPLRGGGAILLAALALLAAVTGLAWARGRRGGRGAGAGRAG